MKFVVLGTFNGSGSSAIVDLLKEFNGFYECNAEIRFITDPYGIIQLERALVDDWDWIASAGAITDYIKLCEKYCHKQSHFPFAKFGLGYNDTINPLFMEITYKYIERLSSFTYIGDFYHYKSQKSYFRYCIDRCRYGIEYYSKGKIKVANRKSQVCYFAHPTNEEFIEATRDYIEELFAPHVRDESYLILDQALTPGQASKIHKYFRNAKMIIAERDPRDMFANELQMVNCDKDNYTREYGLHYCMRQKAMRQGIPEEDSNVIRVQFEKLICNYDTEVKRIAEFLDVPLENHIMPYKYLKPEISISNVAIWNNYIDKYKTIFKVIERELPELLYDIEK